MENSKIITPKLNNDIYAFQAGPEDEETVRELNLQTARWLNSIGSTQWGEMLHGKDKHKLARAIEHGEVFAFRQEGEDELAGSVILQQHPSDWDKGLWGEESTSAGNAVYLHRLVVNRQNSGKGLGAEIVSWTENGIRFTGKDRIRLDCIANNEKLNLFYKRCGYTYKGETNGFSIYEKLLQ